MSILVPGIVLPIEAREEDAIREAARICKISPKKLSAASIFRRSIDARRGNVQFVYSVALDSDAWDEAAVAERLKASGVRRHVHTTMAELLAPNAVSPTAERPVVVGFGPAGIFAALTLARAGLRPIVLERGAALEARDSAVSRFTQTRNLDLASNIQFGEGGAGTYSDGKLTTRINDPLCEVVLDELVAHGAPADILKNAHPHVGTDCLKGVVKAVREEICALGGEVRFLTAAKGFVIKNGRIAAVQTSNGDLAASRLILATGHSARDTFSELLASGVTIVPKSFAVGVRIEHLQSEINAALHGRYAGDPRLGAAEYSVSHREDGRGCFSFCMCPGGYVMAAASECGTVVTNGMSRHARDGKNGNAALAISVDASAFGSDPLGGVAFARSIEQRAYVAGGGDYTAPAQLVGDFLDGRASTRGGRVEPTYPLGVHYGSIEPFLPAGGAELLRTSLALFARRHRFFADRDAVLTAPETRTSSPVRIPRGEGFASVSAEGIYPCGEGAGYAGGIMSAAVDGIKVACAVLKSLKA